MSNLSVHAGSPDIPCDQPSHTPITASGGSPPYQAFLQPAPPNPPGLQLHPASDPDDGWELEAPAGLQPGAEIWIDVVDSVPDAASVKITVRQPVNPP